MTQWGAFIDEMTAVETVKWQQIVARMMWAYRKRQSDPPEGMREWVRFLPEREEWDAVRAEVTRRRRRAAQRRKYPTISVRRAIEAKRRHYMKEYMREYRRKNKRRSLGVETIG